MTKTKKSVELKAHPLIEVLKVFGGAYMRELRSRNTLGYRAKGELANTAIAVQKGIDALRNHNPQRDLAQARERALADEKRLGRGGNSLGL